MKAHPLTCFGCGMLLVILVGGSCRTSRDDAKGSSSTRKHESAPVDRMTAMRHRMVDDQIAARGVVDEAVLEALRVVPRHEFVPASLCDVAYQDRPLPIGYDQTISQPYIVAAMTELAGLDAKSRVLEIGTGSGYQAAVLGAIAAEVYSIEIVEPLGRRAKQTIERLGYENVHLRIGDGYRGWPEKAPFDAILVTAAPLEVPEPLTQQLAVGGRMVLPVGDIFQELRVLTRTETGLEEHAVFSVRFVPMTGEARGAR